MGNKLLNYFSKINLSADTDRTNQIVNIRQYYLIGKELHKQATNIPDSQELVNIVKNITLSTPTFYEDGNDDQKKNATDSSISEVAQQTTDEIKDSSKTADKQITHISIKKDSQNNATKLNNHNVLFLSDAFEDELLSAVFNTEEGSKDSQSSPKSDLATLEKSGEDFARHLLERKTGTQSGEKYSVEKIILAGISIYRLCNMGNIDAKLNEKSYEFNTHSSRFKNANSIFHTLGYIKHLCKLASVPESAISNCEFKYDQSKETLQVIIPIS